VFKIGVAVKKRKFLLRTKNVESYQKM